MAPLIAQLIASGVGILGNALLAKGKEAVEEKLGVVLPDLNQPVPPEKLVELRALEFKHEETLLELAIEKAKIEIEAEKVAQGAVTERWRADMSSDSWLSKNVRPLTLVYWTVAITGLIVLDSFGTKFQVKPAWVSLIETSYTLVLGAYFVGRTVQHLTNIRSRA